MKKLSVVLGLFSIALFANNFNLPEKFDLRNVNGKSYVTSVKSQSGGTCWTHATMSAIEGNMLMNGTWAANAESGEANLAEYHLDWWNGFNQNYNQDIAPSSGGLTVHQGGDFRVASAYVTRGAGVVRDVDGQSYSSAPSATKPSYHFYYVRDIEWFDAGKNLENIDAIKKNIMENGVMAVAYTSSSSYMSGNAQYQPPTSSREPNHAVSIVGWDDNKTTPAPKKGAWIMKNSWGTSKGVNGYYWISYYDKVTGHHPEMGAVAFKNTERMKYSNVYYHDYHGWRDTKANVKEAFNAFTAKGSQSGRGEILKAVSFYVAQDNVRYMVKVYRKFENGELSDLIAMKDGTIERKGFHTLDLDSPVALNAGDKFYVDVDLSEGGHPFDRTSNVPVLLGAEYRVTVKSTAKAGESFYRGSNGWVDLTKDDDSANFCIKALTVNQ